jgi:hypothetical protein
VIFAAGFHWLMTVESTNTDKPKLKKSITVLHTEYNPATGFPMIGGLGGVDTGGNLFGQSSSSLHHH